MTIANTKIGTRLALGFSIVLILLIVVAGIGAWQLRTMSGAVANVVQNAIPKEQLVSEWAANTNLNGARTISVANSGETKAKSDLQARIKETSEKISQIQKTLDSFEKSTEETALFAQIAEKRKTYVAAREDIFKEKLINEENAQKMVQARLEPALEEYVASIRKLSAYQAELIEKTEADITAQSSNSIMLLSILGALSALFGIVVAVVITRSIKNQLGGEPAYTVDIANRIAAGDLALSIDTKAGDTTSLLYAIKAMRDSIANIVGEVRKGTDNIATASREIAAGNLDLSSRTEEQAGALEETASSMEELTSTVNQNADNARQANQMAVSASDVAVQGGIVVAQVVDTMSAINESAKKIVDIIAVIDGIAFQTNILALNAAVEAARAGEQGRGFAVVASEVRTLAQRSAAAAKEIKGLIGDSVEKVEVGSRLVDQAGTTMQEIVNSVKRVTDIMEEVAAASREQSSGIGQINQAITQMDQVTQQNAALVEEAAAAAQSLQDQSANLAEVVSVFKIGGETAGLALQAGTSRADHKRIPAPTKPARLKSVSAPASTNNTVKAGQHGDADWEQF